MYKQAWKFELQRCLAGLLHIAAGLPYAAILVLQSKSVMIRYQRSKYFSINSKSVKSQNRSCVNSRHSRSGSIRKSKHTFWSQECLIVI